MVTMNVFQQVDIHEHIEGIQSPDILMNNWYALRPSYYEVFSVSANHVIRSLPHSLLTQHTTL